MPAASKALSIRLNVAYAVEPLTMPRCSIISAIVLGPVAKKPNSEQSRTY